jgi:hypothetical protein
VEFAGSHADADGERIFFRNRWNKVASRLTYERRYLLLMKLFSLFFGFVFAGVVGAAPQPDFSLPDVNEASARSTQLISPRQYQGQITAWYFGREW